MIGQFVPCESLLLNNNARPCDTTTVRGKFYHTANMAVYEKLLKLNIKTFTVLFVRVSYRNLQALVHDQLETR